MIFLDINTFFSDRGGGIRTYHRAKIDWFAQHPEHTYYVVRPGPKYREEALHPNVVLVECYGIRTGEAYRLMLDYWRVAGLIRRVQPDVVEAGDSWITGIVTLLLRYTGLYRGLLSSFYHGDPIRTWVDPIAQRPGLFRWFRKTIRWLAATGFYTLQRAYPLTVTTSRSTEEHLKSVGCKHVVRAPLGADAMFFEEPEVTDFKSQISDFKSEISSCKSEISNPKSVVSNLKSVVSNLKSEISNLKSEISNLKSEIPDSARPIRLLYAGRLGTEKGAPLLLAVLPRLMKIPGVSLTIIGRGELEEEFKAFSHPRYHFRGYVSDRQEVVRTYRQHDVLLAPGPFETFGLAVLEGLACGLVVIGPDRGGTGEMLREMDSPFIFPTDDAEAFVDAVRGATTADLPELARRSREAAARYGSWNESFARLIGIYKDWTNNSPPRSSGPVSRRTALLPRG